MRLQCGVRFSATQVQEAESSNWSRNLHSHNVCHRHGRFDFVVCCFLCFCKHCFLSGVRVVFNAVKETLITRAMRGGGVGGF
jgi:hypothetical protein